MVDCIKNMFFKKPEEEEPERPIPINPVGEKSFADVADSKIYEMPTIIYHDISVPVKGRYVGNQARGVVVHFTAGWNNKGADSAINTLRNMASRGLGCLVMDIDGIIHVGKNQSIDRDYAYHAGKSVWNGVTSLSKYLIGMEICNGGKLTNGKTWFGHTPKNTRRVAAKHNITAGTYEVFSQAQEKSLINFCLWQLDVNPSFKIEWIVGHEEIAPGRKTDPGGALSMTMPELREMLALKAKRR